MSLKWSNSLHTGQSMPQGWIACIPLLDNVYLLLVPFWKVHISKQSPPYSPHQHNTIFMSCFPDVQLPRCVASQMHSFPDAQLPRCVASQVRSFPGAQLPRRVASQARSLPGAYPPRCVASQVRSFPGASTVSKVHRTGYCSQTEHCIIVASNEQ